jgi:acetyl esterase/lipase
MENIVRASRKARAKNHLAMTISATLALAFLTAVTAVPLKSQPAAGQAPATQSPAAEPAPPLTAPSPVAPAAGVTVSASISTGSEKANAVLRPMIADLAYADKSPFQKLDLYLPTPGNNPSPLVIWIHGGGFTVGDKRSMPHRNLGPPVPRHPTPAGPRGPYQIQVPDVSALTAKGYAVVSLNYRLGFSMYTDAVAAIQDGKAAVRFLRANASKYRLDPTRFAVWGNSAGGYMAAMLGVTGDQPTTFDDATLGNADVSSAVQAVVVWYGAEDRFPVKSSASRIIFRPLKNCRPL